jgi:hypothetical protein
MFRLSGNDYTKYAKKVGKMAFLPIFGGGQKQLPRNIEKILLFIKKKPSPPSLLI